jgi:glycosyltransferase involved in cell wall biosynthesis
MNLRIAILGIRGIPNHYGGFENLAEHLAPALVKAGHEVFVYNSHNHPFKGKSWKGVNIVHCYDPESWTGTVGQFLYDLNCIRDARKRNYDLILQLGYSSSSVWGRLFPAKSVIVYHMDGLEWKRTKYSKVTRRFLLYAEKLAVKFSDFYLCDSRAIQTYLRGKYSIESEYIAYGADLFAQPRESILSDYGLARSGYSLLVARMEPENNIETILDGFSKSRTDKKCVIVGDPGTRFGRHLVKKFGKDKRVLFIGAIYDEQKLQALKFYSHFYFHGHSVGGTNPSLLEAMAGRALIVAHDNVFNREVLGEDAYYFSSSRDIAAIFENVYRGQHEERMIRNNLGKIERQYSWQKTIGRYERYLQECLRIHREGKPNPVIIEEEQYTDEGNIFYRRYADQ